MRKNINGFTIIELIIVIIVIAILATITYVSYGNVQKRALNAARLTEVQDWQKQLMLYYTRNNGIPAGVTAGDYCLGSGFPNGACRNYLESGGATYQESDNETLMYDLQHLNGSLPSGTRKPVNGFIGPFVKIWGSGGGFTIVSFFSGSASSCPAPMTYTWDDGNGAVMCQIDTKYF